jgi:hypothetical protein
MSGNQWGRKVRDPLDDPEAPSVVAPRPAPGNPFAHGNLTGRPTFLPEEGEGGRSEIWSILKGVVAAVVVILAVAWVFSQLY